MRIQNIESLSGGMTGYLAELEIRGGVVGAMAGGCNLTSQHYLFVWFMSVPDPPGIQDGCEK